MRSITLVAATAVVTGATAAIISDTADAGKPVYSYDIANDDHSSSARGMAAAKDEDTNERNSSANVSADGESPSSAARELGGKGKKTRKTQKSYSTGNATPIFVPVAPLPGMQMGGRSPVVGPYAYPSVPYAGPAYADTPLVRSYPEFVQRGAAYSAPSYSVPVPNHLYQSPFAPRSLSTNNSPHGLRGDAPGLFVDPYDVDPYTVEGFYAPALMGSTVTSHAGVAHHTLATNPALKPDAGTTMMRSLKSRKGPGSGPYGYGIEQFYQPHKALVMRRAAADPQEADRLVLDGPHVYNRDAFLREVYRTDGLVAPAKFPFDPAVVARYVINPDERTYVRPASYAGTAVVAPPVYDQPRSRYTTGYPLGFAPDVYAPANAPIFYDSMYPYMPEYVY